MMAARGIPKLDTGPQKSEKVESQSLSLHVDDPNVPYAQIHNSNIYDPPQPN
jgi:hypothetical protein